MLSLDPGEVTRDVALSGNGRLLASAHHGGLVKLWGAVGDASGGEAEREAQSLVRFLFERPLLRSQVVERVQTDTSIGEAARRRALGIATDYPEDVRRLHEVSWAALRDRRAGPAAARAALEQAQAACRIGPDRYQFALGLALARYRTGDCAGAIATLAEAESLAQSQDVLARSVRSGHPFDGPVARRRQDGGKKKPGADRGRLQDEAARAAGLCCHRPGCP